MARIKYSSDSKGYEFEALYRYDRGYVEDFIVRKMGPPFSYKYNQKEVKDYYRERIDLDRELNRLGYY
jgi:hypothetical protein